MYFVKKTQMSLERNALAYKEEHMAIIQCPECGQDISDKAKKCIHCGRILIEDVQPKRFCAECGKEIPIDSQECPFCGCPVEQEPNENPVVTQIANKAQKNKKPLIIGVVVLAVAVLIGLVASLMRSTLTEDEQLAYQNAVKMQSMLKDPDSFRLYDEMCLLKHFDENGENDYTYTIFKYGGANGYGAIVTDEAIFKDGQFIMDYANEPDEDDSNYMEQLFAKTYIELYKLTGDTDTLKLVEIDIEKVKNKMGLK